ncbi:rloF protein [Vibrio ishigakensis]|uniref:RloF protein n=1 Tax=Vibrio ishigakensis TaxID=1481914 RepID=A0A0B8QF36_9VIBR|nr:rloF protein [Vibrio ishigakensis]
MLAKPPSASNSSDTELTPERFNSVINFSNFLLHVLRVSTKQDVALDDKRLLEQFEQYLLKKDQLNTHERIDAVKAFVFALLKTKYLFDQYIIKREFAQGEDKWSLKRLHFYNDKSQSYINTFDSSATNDNEDGFEGINRRILMLLSALHVSTPTLVYKHWLNGALYQLYYMDEISPVAYLEKLEHLARQFVFGRFLQPEGAEYFDMIYQGTGYRALDTNDQSVMDILRYGEIENNLVFNYLDYLLWCDGIESGADAVINQFEFTFRSSVEHFYPQHPLDGHKKLDNSELHRFGNLCLISHSKNSKLSNVQPSAKRDHFKAAINDRSIDTLKLYEMIQHLNNSGEWGVKQIHEHERQMIEILKKDSKTGANG